LQNSLFRIHFAAHAFRPPPGLPQQRSGLLEGPVLAVQTRSQTSFPPLTSIKVPKLTDSVMSATFSAAPWVKTAPGGGQLDGFLSSEFDQLREILACLTLAQERNRAGKTEGVRGEGQWWLTSPRWGGAAPPSKTAADAAPVDQAREEARARKKAEKRAWVKAGGPRGMMMGGKGGSDLDDAPSMAAWDKKTVWTRIGTPSSSFWDSVYLVSSLNHHISIVNVQVSKAYLHFLEKGNLVEELVVGAGLGWDQLKVSRSKWYDLFDVQDRLEAMRGIWGVFAYLMRDLSGDK
jgi:hypothetical protein